MTIPECLRSTDTIHCVQKSYPKGKFEMSILDIASLLILGVLLLGASCSLLIVAKITGQLAKKCHSGWIRNENLESGCSDEKD
jgi:hypothetical protein